MTAPVEHDGVLYWISDGGIAFRGQAGRGRGTLAGAGP